MKTAKIKSNKPIIENKLRNPICPIKVRVSLLKIFPIINNNPKQKKLTTTRLRIIISGFTDIRNLLSGHHHFG
jgi:hypothetical protein